jgi:hypothetical protein
MYYAAISHESSGRDRHRVERERERRERDAVLIAA